MVLEYIDEGPHHWPLVGPPIAVPTAMDPSQNITSPYMMEFFQSEWFKGILEVLSVVAMFGVGKFFAWLAQKLRSRLKFSIRKTQEVRLHLGETRAALRADRGMILQFHNGKKFVGEGKFHSYFLSCTFESIEMGYSAEMENLQNVPISAWSEVITRLMDKPSGGHVVVGYDAASVDYTWEDVKLATYPTRWNISTMVVSLFKSNKDQERGVVVFGFGDDIRPNEIFDIDGEQDDRVKVFIEDLRTRL